MADLNQQLEELVARMKIVDVTYRYGTAVDTRDWELFRTCFVPNATADFGLWGRVEGVDAIIGAAKPVMEGMDMTQHTMINHSVAFDGSGAAATATCGLIAEHLFLTSAGHSMSTTRGVYRDRFVSVDGEWRIEHRFLDVTWREGNVGIFNEAAERFASRRESASAGGSGQASSR